MFFLIRIVSTVKRKTRTDRICLFYRPQRRDAVDLNSVITQWDFNHFWIEQSWIIYTNSFGYLSSYTYFECEVISYCVCQDHFAWIDQCRMNVLFNSFSAGVTNISQSNFYLMFSLVSHQALVVYFFCAVFIRKDHASPRDSKPTLATPWHNLSLHVKSHIAVRTLTS